MGYYIHHMVKALPIVQIVLAVLLAIAILMQQRGTALGGAFGGDSAVYRTRRGVEKFLYIGTIILALTFIASIIASQLI